MDIFARIAAALALLASGATRTDPEVTAHLQAIDEHLAGTDAHEATDNANESARLDVIEAGLQTIANALPAPPADTVPTPTPAPTPAPVDETPVPADGQPTAGVQGDDTAPVGGQPQLAGDGSPAPVPGEGGDVPPVGNAAGTPGVDPLVSGA